MIISKIVKIYFASSVTLDSKEFNFAS